MKYIADDVIASGDKHHKKIKGSAIMLTVGWLEPCCSQSFAAYMESRNIWHYFERSVLLPRPWLGCNLGCVCFKWKSLLEMFFRIYGCLVVRGKCIFWKWFSIDLCWGCKLIFVFILPSNTIFRKTERELSLREIEEEERGIEHTPLASQALAREIAPRERSNLEPSSQPRAHFAV